MSMDSTAEQVARHIGIFYKAGEVTELRAAANLIDRRQVGGEDRQAARARKLDLWLTLFDAIDSAIDPGFDPEDLPAARVSIPAGTALKPGYMTRTPEAIADPEARRKYDEKVAANAAKTERYRVQKELRQMDAELTMRFETYLKKASPRSAESLQEMDAALDAHLNSAARAAYLRSLVRP